MKKPNLIMLDDTVEEIMGLSVKGWEKWGTKMILEAMRREEEARRKQDQFYIERAQAKRERKAREKAARHGQSTQPQTNP